MNITVKKLPQSKVEISATLPWEEWKSEIDHAVEYLAKEVKIAGFRSGKAPRDVIEKRVGKGVILAEAAEHVVSHSYPKVLAQEKIVAIGKPEIKLGEVAEKKSFEYRAITDVMPEVTLKDWKGAVKKNNADFTKKADVIDEKEVEAELEKLAAMRAKLITVNREAKIGDNVVIDFVVQQDGVVIEGGKSENHPLILGKGVFIPGFEEQIVGMKEREEKTFTLTFPLEYHAKHLANKSAEFSVKVRVVQEREIPAIDDAFAQNIGKFESLQKVKENIRNGMLEEKKRKDKEERRAQVLEALVVRATIEYPQILVDEESSRMVREFETQTKQMGLNFEDYLTQAKKTEADLRAEWEPQAKKRIAAHLILDKLAEEEAIDVASEEIEAEMNKALQYYKNVKEAEKNIDMEHLYSAVRGQMRNEKVFTFLENL